MMKKSGKVVLLLLSLGLAAGASAYIVIEKPFEKKEASCNAENYVVFPAVEATCTEDGFTEGVYCGDCGAVIVEHKVIEAKGHTETVLPGVEETCTENGLTDRVICADCGTVLVEQEVVEAKGHTQTVLPAVEATCTENGFTEGVVCGDCGEIIVAQEIIAAKGHTQTVLPEVEATCTENGWTACVACLDCGTVLSGQEMVEPLGHNYVSGICARCEDGKGYVDTLAPTGYMYQKPLLNEKVSGAVYRLGKSKTAIYMSLKSTVANKVFGVYGDHLGELNVEYETNARFFTEDGYQFVVFPETGFFVVIDGVKYTDEDVVVTGIDNIVDVTPTSALHLYSLSSEFALWQTDGENVIFDGSKVTFTGVDAGGLATKESYTNFDLEFDVIENSFERAYFAFGVAAPEVGSGLLDSAFIQFNRDQIFVTTSDGRQYQYWNRSLSWKISVTDGYLTLFDGEGNVICQNVALGATTGHITLQGAKGCDVTIDNIVISLYK